MARHRRRRDHGEPCAARRVDCSPAVPKRAKAEWHEGAKARGPNMTDIDSSLTRRSALFAAGASLLQTSTLFAREKQVITVHRDPTCSCCSGWVEHLQKAGLDTKVFDISDLEAVKRRLGVPDDLAACHTAEVAGYIVEGHVPAAALKRLLAEKPDAAGLAVPGMPIGSPGMEGGRPEKYDVVLFGPNGRRTYMSFIGEQSV